MVFDWILPEREREGEGGRATAGLRQRHPFLDLIFGVRPSSKFSYPRFFFF